MKTYMLVMAVLAGTATVAHVSPVAAREYPICVQGMYRFAGEGDSIRCEYDNLAQCRAATFGFTGTCIDNPLYKANVREQRRPNRRER